MIQRYRANGDGMYPITDADLDRWPANAFCTHDDVTKLEAELLALQKQVKELAAERDDEAAVRKELSMQLTAMEAGIRKLIDACPACEGTSDECGACVQLRKLLEGKQS